MQASLRRPLRRLAFVSLGAILIALAACEKKDSPFAPLTDDFEATVVGTEVRLAWSHSSEVQAVRLLRRLNADPEGPDDPAATLVFQGEGAGCIDSVAHLLPNTTSTARVYHYALFACPDGVDCVPGEASSASVSVSLLTALRAGGYVIWWRHASATVCADRTDLGTAATTTSPNWWKSCNADCPTATARQLSTTGENEATSIGQSFNTLAIPVGRVLSAEYCRCVHTAELNDFGPTIEQVQDITFFVYDEANRCASSMAHIVQLPASGTNTAIIGQAGFSGACPVLGELAWGEAAIYRPLGDGTATLIQRLLWNEWPLLTSSPQP